MADEDKESLLFSFGMNVIFMNETGVSFMYLFMMHDRMK